MLYQPLPADAARTALAAADPFADRQSSTPRVRMPSPDPHPAAPAAVAAETAAPLPMNDAEKAALEEIHRRVKGGAEVLCIIRDRNDPQARSEVISLDRASTAFVKELTSESHSPNGTHGDVAGDSPRRTPILEWDAQCGYRHREPLPIVR